MSNAQSNNGNGIITNGTDHYTIEDAKKAVECGVDLICTDRPDIVNVDAMKEIK